MKTEKKKMNKKQLQILGIVLIVIICIIGVSYAYWRLTLSQTGVNEIASSCFDITLSNEQNDINLQKAYPISDKEGMNLTPYTFTITNHCDAFAEYQINLEVLEGTTLNSEYIKAVLNSENPKILSEKEQVEKTLENATTSYKLKTGYLEANESKTYELRLWMDYDTPATEDAMNKLFQSKITITASYVPEIPQNTLMKGPDFEIAFTPEIILAASSEEDLFSVTGDAIIQSSAELFMLNIDSDSFWQYSNQILTINFEVEMNPPENASYTYDVSERQDGSVMAYLVPNNSLGDTGEIVFYDLYIQANGEIIANQDFSGWFAGMFYLFQINGTENIDTSNVTNMSNLFAGSGYFALITKTGEIPEITANINLNFLNTSSVTDMSGMFAFSFLQNILSVNESISKFDTSNVENIRNMFLYTMDIVQEGTTSKIDISNWNTSNVRDMSGLFGLYRGNEIIIKGINTTNVTNMKGMFATFSKYLTSLDLSGISTENVTDMSWMFAETRSLTTLDLSNFNTSKVTDMSSMFYGLSSLTALDVSHFKTSKVTDMSWMFAGLDMQELNLSSFDTSNTTNMLGMFQSTRLDTTLDLSSFNTTKVTDLSAMFAFTDIDTVDLSSFDTSSVTNFASMFTTDSSRAGVKNAIYGPNFVYRNNADVTDMFYYVNTNRPTDPSWEGVL